jgi:hypothetical protein
MDRSEPHMCAMTVWLLAAMSGTAITVTLAVVAVVTHWG